MEQYIQKMNDFILQLNEVQVVIDYHKEEVQTLRNENALLKSSIEIMEKEIEVLDNKNINLQILNDSNPAMEENSILKKKLDDFIVELDDIIKKLKD
jgi:dynactin complex subunit